MSADLSLLDSARQRLQARLLTGPLQLQEGPHAGAVAGSMDASGRIRYVYGEITGYYLHWLASLDNPGQAARDRARAAADWLDKLLQSETPKTRIYLGDEEADWRNGALFSFDFAMMAGGLAQVHNRGLHIPADAQYERLQACLLRFAGQDGLLASLNTGGQALPRRWSTDGGPFMAKTASRILMLSAHVRLADPLRDACIHVLQSIGKQVANLPPEMLHPTLYAFEGVLLAPEPDATSLGCALEQMLELLGEDGSLPESLQTPDVRRSDIIAQALRVGVFVLPAYSGKRLAASLGQLATCLASRVDGSGRLAFDPARGDGGENIWCAMFAEQALRLYVDFCRHQPLPFGPDLVA